MEKNPNEEGFAPFPYFTKTQTGKGDVNSYLVYSSPSECKRVKAGSASEAMRVSGIVKPLKIVRFDLLNQVLLSQGCFE